MEWVNVWVFLAICLVVIMTITMDTVLTQPMDHTGWFGWNSRVTQVFDLQVGRVYRMSWDCGAMVSNHALVIAANHTCRLVQIAIPIETKTSGTIGFFRNFRMCHQRHSLWNVTELDDNADDDDKDWMQTTDMGISVPYDVLFIAYNAYWRNTPAVYPFWYRAWRLHHGYRCCQSLLDDVCI
jgi:hypothetical protein